MSPPIVVVKWIDSASHSGWMPAEEGLTVDVMQCQSVGYLIQKTRKMIAIAQSLSTEEVGDVLCIPTSIIKELTELEKPD